MTSPSIQALFHPSSSAATLSDAAKSSQGCGVFARQQRSSRTHRTENRSPIPCKVPILSFTALTFTGRHRFAYAPFPVGLAPDDPLACVVVPGVTDEH